MKKIILSALLLSAALYASPAQAQTCAGMPSHDLLKKALTTVRKQDNGGLNLDMWGTVVDRSGKVCSVFYTGATEDAQWPGSRVISAQKANTANAFSLKGLALSTANLYGAVQPGAPLFGLQDSNPVDTAAAYAGDAASYGSGKDPMVGKKVGGINVFGGGLALYNTKGVIVGALGVSGDTSCADHNIAWRLRHMLALDYVPAGVSPDKNDQIIYDMLDNGRSKGGYGHPPCGNKEADVSDELPKTGTLAAAPAAPVKAEAPAKTEAPAKAEVKEEPKKEEVKKEEPKKDEMKKDEPAKDAPKEEKSDK